MTNEQTIPTNPFGRPTSYSDINGAKSFAKIKLLSPTVAYKIFSKIIEPFDMSLEVSSNGTALINHRNFSISTTENFIIDLLKAAFRLEADLCFGEGYMHEKWWVQEGELEDVLLVFHNLLEYRIFSSQVIRFIRRQHFLKNQSNNPETSKKNASYHYDLSNRFYTYFLDQDMTYSAGIYLSSEDNLENAQKNKQALLVKMLDVKKGQKILEIGCGWGSLSRLVADRECQVTGISLSSAQISWGIEKFQTTKSNVQNPNFYVEDYRDHCKKNPTAYDRAISVEMFDHVGKAHHVEFFQSVSNSLKSNGLFVLQVLTRPKIGETTKWIDKYIFPGGYITSYEEMKVAFEKAGFELIEKKHFDGIHYARTLIEWRKRFKEHWSTIKQDLKYDNVFYRMWFYYLASSIMVFRDANFETVHLTLKKKF